MALAAFNPKIAGLTVFNREDSGVSGNLPERWRR